MPDSPAPVSPLDQLLPTGTQDALAHLELSARRIVDGMMHGLHRSRRPGVSTQFDHHKNYQPGDSRKHIDWKVSARHDRLYVKRYLEDTALRVTLVVDRSGSMARATQERSKDLWACRLAACLAYLVVNQHDLVGLLMTQSPSPLRQRTGSSRRHMVQLLQALVSRPPQGPDALEQGLRQLAASPEPRGLVVIISDLLLDPLPIQSLLAQLSARGHEILLMAVRDPVEEDFPFNRWVLFNDLEQAGKTLRVDALTLQHLYREEFARLTEAWRAWARKYSVHWMAVRTDESLETALTSYFEYRNGITRAWR